MTTGRRALAGYELEHRLGEGGAGTVWRARQLSSLGRPVAVKRLRPLVPDGADQLRIEAAVLVGLDHPHIVRVFEVVPDGDDGVAMAMQWASGGSLEERLARRGRVAPPEVGAIVRKLAGALASAHRRGVLHGDVKPGNVLFTSDGEPLLADFGIAAGVDDGVVRGTEGYTDPTVLAGRVPDASSDLYALAAMATEMLGGSLDGAPEPLASALARCLADDPAARFASADALLARLDGVAVAVAPDLSGEDAAAGSIGRVTTRSFGPRPPVPPAAVRPLMPWRALVAVGGGVLVVAGAAVALRPTSTPVAASPAVACAPLPKTGGGLVGDVDGNGCDDLVPTDGNVVTYEGRRYEVGVAGDVVVLGDWDCDGDATPGVIRPTTGEAHLFDGWADPNRPLPATRTVAASAPPTANCP